MPNVVRFEPIRGSTRKLMSRGPGAANNTAMLELHELQARVRLNYDLSSLAEQLVGFVDHQTQLLALLPCSSGTQAVETMIAHAKGSIDDFARTIESERQSILE